MDVNRATREKTACKPAALGIMETTVTRTAVIALTTKHVTSLTGTVYLVVESVINLHSVLKNVTTTCMEQAVQRLVDNVVTQNHVTTLMAPVWTDVRQVLREHYVQKNAISGIMELGVFKNAVPSVKRHVTVTM